MPSAPPGPPSPRKGGARPRLDSWKEIAEYLGRGERTVKRWESERALPVHHVPGGGHGSVYAFTAELDEWLLSEKRKEPGPTESGESGSITPPDAVVTRHPEAARAKGKSSFLVRNPRASRVLWRLGFYVVMLAVLLLCVAYVVNPRITNAYASSLLRSLLARPKSEPATAYSDPEKQLAHDLYLRGRFEWNKRTPDSLNRALDYFTQAIVHDPGNAQAYVGLADTYNLLREYTLMPESEAYKRAIAAAKKAIQLDDSLAEAHRSLAFDEIWGNWDFEAGEREFQRAMELNPRDPVAHLWFANAFAAPGWYGVCLREMDRAQELDPSSHAILADKGNLLFHAGQREQGLELEKQVEGTDPEFLSPHRYLAGMYIHLHDYANFLAESDKAAELTHDEMRKEINAAARRGFQRDGERGLLQDLYLSQKRFHNEGKLSNTVLAKTCAKIGKKQEALQLLRQDYESHSPAFLYIRQDLDLLTLKGEPEYQELLRSIHSPAPEGLTDAARTP